METLKVFYLYLLLVKQSNRVLKTHCERILELATVLLTHETTESEYTRIRSYAFL